MVRFGVRVTPSIDSSTPVISSSEFRIMRLEECEMDSIKEAGLVKQGQSRVLVIVLVRYVGFRLSWRSGVRWLGLGVGLGWWWLGAVVVRVRLRVAVVRWWWW